MNKKMLKISTTLLIAMVTILVIAGNVFALEPSALTGNDDVQGVDQITNVGNDIIGIIRTVGIIISVVVLIVLGIKYMMGSAEEKAEYKKTMIPYIVGAALIFAASVFAQVAYNFFSGIKLG